MLRNLTNTAFRFRPKTPIIQTSTRFSSAMTVEDRCVKQNLEDLEVKGFTVVKDIFTPEQIKEL